MISVRSVTSHRVVPMKIKPSHHLLSARMPIPPPFRSHLFCSTHRLGFIGVHASHHHLPAAASNFSCPGNGTILQVATTFGLSLICSLSTCFADIGTQKPSEWMDDSKARRGPKDGFCPPCSWCPRWVQSVATKQRTRIGSKTVFISDSTVESSSNCLTLHLLECYLSCFPDGESVRFTQWPKKYRIDWTPQVEARRCRGKKIKERGNL